MNQLREKLWIGDGATVQNNPVPLKQKGITAVLNVASDYPTKVDAMYNFQCAHIPLRDNTLKNPRWLFELAVSTLKTLIDNGHTVYVHCRCGINRAPTVCALYLAATEGLSFADAWQQIRKIRPQVYERSNVLPNGLT